MSDQNQQSDAFGGMDLVDLIAETLAYQEVREIVQPFEDPYAISNDELELRKLGRMAAATEVVRVLALVAQMHNPGLREAADNVIAQTPFFGTPRVKQSASGEPDSAGSQGDA